MFFTNLDKSLNLTFCFEILIYKIAIVTNWFKIHLETKSNVQKEANTPERMIGNGRVKWK